MPPSKKRSRTANQRKPPAGTAYAGDNQGESSTCVRFALGKAMANLLFKKHSIDVDQRQIMNCLVQVMASIKGINPIMYNTKVLYLQDEKNEYLGPSGEKHKNSSWWKVRHFLFQCTCTKLLLIYVST